MGVPFVDLKTQYRALKPEMDRAVQSVLERTAFIMGKEHDDFERAFGSYIGTRHCLGVSSGTDALELALRACDIGPGDEVITVPNTFIATTEAISSVGATIRWVDCDSLTYNMDPAKIEAAITSRTKAVLPVHLYGQPANMGPIMAVARQHSLRVIEDCAQSHGASYCGQKTGTFGDVACFSFYPGKNLGAYGDGGAVLTNDDAIADRARLLRNHGARQKYVHDIEGYCRRLDNLQAAVLGVKLSHLNEWNAARRRAAAMYDSLLCEVAEVVTPYVRDDVEPVYHLYVIQVPEREQIQAALRADGVETGIHYPIPLHQQPAYRHLGYKAEDFPITAHAAPRLLSLPMFPEITGEQIATVVRALSKAMV